MSHIIGPHCSSICMQPIATDEVVWYLCCHIHEHFKNGWTDQNCGLDGPEEPGVRWGAGRDSPAEGTKFWGLSGPL